MHLIIIHLFSFSVSCNHTIGPFNWSVLVIWSSYAKNSFGVIFGVCLFVRHVICANAIVVAVLILTSIHILYVNHTVYSRANFVIEFNYCCLSVILIDPTVQQLCRLPALKCYIESWGKCYCHHNISLKVLPTMLTCALRASPPYNTFTDMNSERSLQSHLSYLHRWYWCHYPVGQ